MVGQWAHDPALIAQNVFQRQLKDGWSRKRKRTTQDDGVEGDSIANAIDLDDPIVLD